MKWLFGIIVIVSLLIITAVSMSGDGALKQRFTLSGIYAVEPNGYDVVCFVNRAGGAMHCLNK